MKLRAFLIAGSAALNAALLIALTIRPELAPPAFRDYFARHFHSGAKAPAAPIAKRASIAPARPKLWSTLDTGDDLAGLVARLRAAGFPANLIRAIVSSNVSARYDARLRAYWESDPNTPFWKLRPNFMSSDDKRYVEMMQLQRERTKLLRELFADPFFATDDVTTGQRRQFGDLSRQKVDAVQRIADDYAEMATTVRAAMGGITLPEDREKLALLAREKQADLAAVLTPEELADYTIHSSPVTNFLRTRIGDFDPTDSEFLGLFQAYKALSDKFPGGYADLGADFRQREAVQQQFDNQLRSTLGEARYADYVRAMDSNFQQVNLIAQRQNIPPETALQAYDVRDTVAQESNRIFDDTSLTTDQKRTALQSLAQTARGQINALLGPNAGPAYVQVVNQWLTTVEQGSAVKFNISAGMALVSDGGGWTTVNGNGTTYRRLPNQPPGH